MPIPLPYDPSSAIASPVEVLRVTAALAFPDMEMFYRPDGRLRAIHEVPAHAARGITGIDVVTRNGQSEVLAIHLGDHRQALRLLLRCLGLSTRRAAAVARAQPPVPRVLRPRRPSLTPSEQQTNTAHGEADDATHER